MTSRGLFNQVDQLVRCLIRDVIFSEAADDLMLQLGGLGRNFAFLLLAFLPNFVQLYEVFLGVGTDL